MFLSHFVLITFGHCHFIPHVFNTLQILFLVVALCLFDLLSHGHLLVLVLKFLLMSYFIYKVRINSFESKCEFLVTLLLLHLVFEEFLQVLVLPLFL